ncbi:MAG: hypothetical protein LBC68_03790 [Prevotellaceae bacterium]|jgi:hypothetical protein|nr:hypothetical protein [Prevotellaceae bacterium]
MKHYKTYKKTGIIFLAIFIFFTNRLNAQVKRLNPDSLRNDVNLLFKNIGEIHPDMFATLDEKDFAKELSAIKSKINSNADIFDFYLLINSLVVKLNDGHTSISFPHNDLEQSNGLLFPFPIKINPGDSSVTITNDYTKSGNSIPVNSEVLSINGIQIKEIVGRMTQQVSGEQTFYRIDRLTYLFTPLLYALYKSEEFEVEYRHNESIYNNRIQGISYYERYERRSQAADRETIRPYSLQVDSMNSFAIIDFRQFVDLENFTKFLDSTFTCLKNQKINNLIIDVRNNGGGNSRLGDELFQYISKVPFKQYGQTTIKTSEQQKNFFRSEYNINDTSAIGVVTRSNEELIELRDNDLRFNGNVYVLQSHYTFSSASGFSWAFKYFGMGEIIGEETGGLAVCFGDIVRQRLPYSGFSYTVSHKKFYQYGATDDNIHGTIPDYEVPANNALSFAVELIKMKKQK